MACGSVVELAFDTYLPAEKQNLPDVILLHGITRTKSTWKFIAQIIADQTYRTVYAVDLRNHGHSPWTPDLNNEIMAKDVLKFMEDQMITSAVFVGHCMGASLATYIACTEEGKVSKLIAEDGSPDLPSQEHFQNFIPIMIERFTSLRRTVESISSKTDIIEAKNLIINDQLEKYGIKKIQHFVQGRALEDELTTRGDHYALLSNMDVCQKALEEDSMKSEYEGVYQGPSLFICGAKSVFEVYQYEDEILARCPNAVLRLVENFGHLLHQFYPEEFSKIVIDFINEI